jgi:hypothetical protein
VRTGVAALVFSTLSSASSAKHLSLQEIDILVMGSSYMEALQVLQTENTVSVGQTGARAVCFLVQYLSLYVFFRLHCSYIIIVPGLKQEITFYLPRV